jgi:hypothetical protein
MAVVHNYPAGNQLGVDEPLHFNTTTTLYCSDACRHSIMRSPVRVGRYNANRLHASGLHAAENQVLR